jgi:hypothetical protein
LLKKKEKFTLKTAKAEGALYSVWFDGKDVVSAVSIPVLVFDCVALRLREGKSRLFPERKGTCFSCALFFTFLAIFF